VVILLLPVTLLLLGLDASRAGQATAETHNATKGDTPPVNVGGTVITSLKMPIVWLPTIGFVLVPFGVELPKIVDQSLLLLGHSSSGVALFASGIILAGYKVTFSVPVLSLVFIKNVAQPALVCVGMLALGYKNPTLGQTVVTTALPAVALVVMLAVQFRTAIPEAASALMISTFGSLLTISLFIWLVG
jgi:malonate transporter